MSYPQMRRTGFLDSRGVMKAITRSHGNLIARAAGVPGVQMRISPGVGSHNQGWAIDFQPGPPWSSAHVVLQRIADVIYQHWDWLGVRYMAWNSEEFGGTNPSRTNRRRQTTNYGGSDPFHRNHVHVDFRPNAPVRSSLPGSTPAATPTPTPDPPVLEGDVMTSARDVWAHRGLDYVNDDATTKNSQLARAHEYAWSIWARIRSNEWADWLASRFWNRRNGESNVSLARHVRRGDFRFRGLDYVNENPSTKDAQIARAHQYSRDTRNEIREVKAMVKALAKAQDEGNTRILEAVENAEREAIEVNVRIVDDERKATADDDSNDD